MAALPSPLQVSRASWDWSTKRLAPVRVKPTMSFTSWRASQPSSFRDVTSGTIAMPCAAGTPNCTVNTSGHPYGVLSGYSTGVGYDAATGLGSVNANNLVTNWSSVTFTPSTTTLSITPTTGITHGQSVTVTIGVTPVPTSSADTVSLMTTAGKGIAGFKLANGQGSGTTTALPGGTYTVQAHFPGDSTYGSSNSAPVSLIVGKENALMDLSLITFDSQGHILNPHAMTAVYGSPYILRIDVTPSSGIACTNCPSGTVALIDNGSLLDGGSFALNTQGYAEDQLVQFPGGTNGVTATYPGDNSFSVTDNPLGAVYTITPASTTLSGITAGNATIGVPFQISTTVQTQSSGVAPTGTVTFLANGVPLSGSIAYSPVAGSFAASASLTATITTILSSGGSYALSANYAGDGNYTGSSERGQHYRKVCDTIRHPQPPDGKRTAGCQRHTDCVSGHNQ